MPIPRGKKKLAEEIRWRGTGGITDDEAKVFGPELRRLTQEAERRGEVLTPASIVDAAREDDSPFHQRIWGLDDEQAAAQYRLNQARYIVVHVVEDVVGEDGRITQQRPIVNLPADDEHTRGYQDRRMVDPALYRSYRLSQAFADMRSFARRHGDLPELESVVRAIERVLQLHGEEL